MLIAVIADIHGNLQALNAVLKVIDDAGAERILCAGDIIGYGANPAQCLDVIREKGILCCCGNHDSYVVSDEAMPSGKIRKEAMDAIRWTRGQLSKDQLQWLSELPMALYADEYMVTHSSCQPYPKWNYVTSLRDAAVHFLFQRRRLCFNGHCHVPLLALHKNSEKISFARLGNCTLPQDTNAMISVGAVGQPRDGDNRASAVLYDTDTGCLELLRIEYDIAAAQRAIYDSGLPVFLSDRLLNGI